MPGADPQTKTMAITQGQLPQCRIPAYSADRRFSAPQRQLGQHGGLHADGPVLCVRGVGAQASSSQNGTSPLGLPATPGPRPGPRERRAAFVPVPAAV